MLDVKCEKENAAIDSTLCFGGSCDNGKKSKRPLLQRYAISYSLLELRILVNEHYEILGRSLARFNAQCDDAVSKS